MRDGVIGSRSSWEVLAFFTASLQAAWVGDKFPRQTKSSLQPSRQRFDPERLGGVMTGVNQIHPKLLCERVRPVRAFSREQSVDSIAGNFLNFRTGGTR